MRRICLAVTAVLFVVSGMSPTAQRPAPAGAPSKLQLTVDSVMRGPALVGWPPTAVRWSADSRNLFFDWRKPGEKESSTYVVVARGGRTT